MRLALVASGTYFSEYGGGQILRSSTRVSCAIAGIDVHVLAVEQGAHTEARQPVPVDDSGVRVWRIAMHPDVSQSRLLALSPKLQEQLSEAIGSIAPNIVHAHGWKAATARTYDLSCPVSSPRIFGGIVCPMAC
ncbi:MAG: hypothetical protein IPO95_13360 [Rhodanobacteraceae bacterium]|nr:hypothetical protein [Rhodanobacteraceae bacterium]